MKYEELYDEFKKLFPEYADYFKAKEEETGAEVEIGMHVVFGMVVCPFIIKMAEDEIGRAPSELQAQKKALSRLLS